MNRWRLIDTGVGLPSYNMAVDEALLHNFNVNDLPIFRLYGWKDSLSFGRFSDLSQSINLNTMYNKGFSYSRRMTGGGILAHGEDLSYSLILPRETLKELGVKKSYYYLCRFLINFYAKLGLKAEFASDLHLESSPSNICMSANEAYDIMIDGKKIGGNAQRYTKDALFQHGTIPISLNNERFQDLFLEDSGLEEMVVLDRIKKDVLREQLITLLLEAFSETFEIHFQNDTLSPLESHNRDELLKYKYTQQSWNIDAKQD